MKHNFVDYVKIYFTSGKGGAGAVSWRREKFVPFGGPDGGDGGNGGSIYLRGNKQMWTLLDLKYRKFIKAEAGEPGKGARRNGKTGKDIILDVPLGVVVKDAETLQEIGEITDDEQKLLVLPGGKGGLGNWHFRSSVNQTPEYAQPGEPARELAVIIELKLLADVGLVGFPNAGKSTLLSVLTTARPQIADYPFTTLVPNLGIVKYKDFNSFVMADIPGIISGASEGRGLGTQFLRHIERNSILLFLIAVDCEDIAEEYRILDYELNQYDSELSLKPRVIAVTKCDLLPGLERTEDEVRTALPKDVPVLLISSITGQGLEELRETLWQILVQDEIVSLA